jgi:hypothetical protein
MNKKISLTNVSDQEMKNSKAGAVTIYPGTAQIPMLEPYQCYGICTCTCMLGDSSGDLSWDVNLHISQTSVTRK